MITVDSPVASVFGRSHQKRQRVREGLGVDTVGDLLFHFPRRYVRTNELSDVAEPVEGDLLSVVGRITSSELKTFRDRRTRRPSFRVEVRIATNGPEFSMSFFSPYESQAQKDVRRMAPGRLGLFTGKAKRFGRTWQIAQPHSVVFDEEGDGGLAASMKGLLPVYPVTAKVYSWDVQKVVQTALDVVEDVPDPLPAAVRQEHGLLDVMTALRWIHGPDDFEQVGAAQKRFRFEEALVTQLVLARRRARQRALGARPRTGGGGLLKAFDARLPFELTAGQQEVGDQIERDLAADHPMHRLLQGEVGSGKTLVALRAMLRVVDSGAQAALLAPTEVLAQQHHRSIAALLGDLAGGGMLGGAAEATGLALLTGSMNRAQRQEALLRITTGEAGIVIGTHALLEGGVEFADLGLVVVDEQHRFGVEQRA
ncbi:MAG TPA: DEAD/DEAH box helicase, partial [Nocardioides sp.]|nr:DEAD/DEAH box helicase [Nocardioides sp.]